ncbi:NfeD family protein [Celerinatantimonas sp. MCCC 1A17872]|uniref:NfeD family protein n=1 Tax=Celerinatantimonas sp. MCCC 1A17872 TaxID=3177514 RepID=UPI0038CA126E
MISIDWWILVVLGVVLITSELLVTAFVLMWFGFGFVLSGMVSYFAPSLNWGIQVLIAAVVGGVSLYIGRRFCVQSDNEVNPQIYTFEGGLGELVIRDDNGHQLVSVRCRGTYWSVANPQILQQHPGLVHGSGVSVEKIIDNKAVIKPL